MVNSDKEKEKHQDRVIELLHANNDHAVTKHDDTLISVYLSRDNDESPRESRLSLFPVSDYEPYQIEIVIPLPDDDKFAAQVILKPDWRKLED